MCGSFDDATAFSSSELADCNQILYRRLGLCLFCLLKFALNPHVNLLYDQEIRSGDLDSRETYRSTVGTPSGRCLAR